jgi:hypothetical protein
VQLAQGCGQSLVAPRRGLDASRCALAQELLDGGIHSLGVSSGQAAQQESLVRSQVKAWAASLRPSPMVR